MSDQLVADAAA